MKREEIIEILKQTYNYTIKIDGWVNLGTFGFNLKRKGFDYSTSGTPKFSKFIAQYSDIFDIKNDNSKLPPTVYIRLKTDSQFTPPPIVIANTISKNNSKPPLKQNTAESKSKEILKSIAENWKLEAKLEIKKDYFYHSQEVNMILNNSKYYVIGRKGSGKSSISEYLLGLKNYNTFSEKLSFKNFPFNELYGLDNQKYTPPNQYITLWKYLIYSTVAKLMVGNEKINSSVRNKLGEIYTPDPIRSLSRTISHWTSAEFGANVIGTGGTFKLSRDVKSQSTNWVDRVNNLEDIILEYCDDSKYFIIFDELDEDYRAIKSSEHEQYNFLLTSLFKAVQDIKYTFNSTNKNICPIVFLRDDIYALIKDSDKNKWRDFKIEIEWTPERIKQLLAYRISKDVDAESSLPFNQTWSMIFASDQIRSGSGRLTLSSFDYITRSTHLRPRDYISYIQTCAEETIGFGRSKISNETIKFVDRAFSNYLKDEIVDEIYPLLPDIEEVFQIISNLRKWSFSTAEFKDEYNKYLTSKTVTEENVDYVLDILYKFSVLGNQHKRLTDTLYFKYMHTNMNLNRSEQLVVHRGLFKALQII